MGEAGLGQEGPGNQDREDAEGAGLLSKTALPANLHPIYSGHLEGTAPGIREALGKYWLVFILTVYISPASLTIAS